MKLYYLAHPVAADDQYTVEENLAHILKLQRLFYEHGIMTIAPYYSWVTLFLNERTEEHMDAMLRMDVKALSNCEGTILTGHKVSRGMFVEMQEAVICHPDRCLSFVGLSDENLDKFLDENMNTIFLP